MYEEFLGNPFFISGESYAGVYVPTLAAEVVKGLDLGVKPVINFKGYTVGNGVADEVFDGNALVPFTHGMGLISNDLYDSIIKECQGNYYVPTTESCENLLAKVDEEVSGLNIYDILEPCYHGSSTRSATTGNIRLPSSFKKLGETKRPLPVRKRMFGRAWPLRAPVRDGIVPMWPQLANSESVPCMDDEVATLWLNNDAVRKALHAEEAKVAGPWELCTDRLSFTHDAGSMIPYHKNLTSRAYRALIYSGDHDMCVPYTGSEAWTRSMGYKIIDEWRPWNSNGQVAGYTQGYDNNLTFLTIKGAGHTVPEYKPQEALDFYSRVRDLLMGMFMMGKNGNSGTIAEAWLNATCILSPEINGPRHGTIVDCSMTGQGTKCHGHRGRRGGGGCDDRANRAVVEEMVVVVTSLTQDNLPHGRECCLNPDTAYLTAKYAAERFQLKEFEQRLEPGMSQLNVN
ncbi:carbohydrate-binding module 1 protein [Ancistrocladus abbreviatus]